MRSLYFFCTPLARPTLPVGTLLKIAGAGLLLMLQTGLSEAAEMAYFKDPEQAVDSIRALLLSNAWEELSNYYDLSGTDIGKASLVSGEFFIRKKRPTLSHPEEFWKYKEPFAPQFNYRSYRTLTDGLISVTMDIEIDQGGGMIQRGLHTFPLRKSAMGYQLLPKSFLPETDPFSIPKKLIQEVTMPGLDTTAPSPLSSEEMDKLLRDLKK